MRRRRVLEASGAVVLSSLAGCVTESASTTPLAVTSPAVSDGGTLPRQFTCDGDGDSPPLTVDSVPEATAALGVVVRSTVGVLDNPALWTLWNVPADTTAIPAGLPRTQTVDSLGSARQGTAGDHEPGYRPPCPPRGQAYEHWIQVYALGETLAATAGMGNDDALEAIEGAQLASTRITISYTRSETTTE